MSKTKQIVNYQKNRSLDTYDKVYNALYNMVIANEKINFYTVAERAGVSRAYLYQHEDFSFFIKTCALTAKQGHSPASLKENCEKARQRLKAVYDRYDVVERELNELLEKYKSEE